MENFENSFGIKGVWYKSQPGNGCYGCILQDDSESICSSAYRPRCTADNREDATSVIFIIDEDKMNATKPVVKTVETKEETKMNLTELRDTLENHQNILSSIKDKLFTLISEIESISDDIGSIVSDIDAETSDAEDQVVVTITFEKFKKFLTLGSITELSGVAVQSGYRSNLRLNAQDKIRPPVATLEDDDILEVTKFYLSAHDGSDIDFEDFQRITSLM